MLALTRWIKPALIFAAIVVTILVLRYGYDTLIDEQHRLHVAHGRVLIEQQQRWDVISRSWDAVERYRDLEQKIMERLVAINGLIKTGGGKARIEEERKKVASLAAELDLLKEEYPALQGKDPYLFLMELMESAGMRVTKARLVYNERVYHYNVMCRLFPYVLFAKLFGYQQEHYLRAEAEGTGVRYR